MARDAVRLTGLWKEEGKDGSSYLAGSLSPTSRLLIFRQTDKKSEKAPDYVAYLVPAEKKEQKQQAEATASEDF